MGRVLTIRRLMLTLLAVTAVIGGSIISVPTLSGIVSNSRWEDAGSPWEFDLFDPESPAGLTLTGVAQKSDSDAIVVVKNGRIVFEYYSGLSSRLGYRLSSFLQGPNQLYGTSSLAKALVGSMAFLVAVSDELVYFDDPAAQYVQGWKDDSIRNSITLGQLASHTSGIPHGRKSGNNRAEWEIAFWSKRPDLFDRIIEDVEPSFEPGTEYQYSGPAWAALGYAVTAAIAHTPTDNIQSLLSRRIMEPIGIPGGEWRIGYGRVFNSDDMELYATWGGAMFTARAAARIGQLMLHRGSWNGNQLISSEAANKLKSYTGTQISVAHNRPVSAAGWWFNLNNNLRFLPSDAYVGAGAGHQVLIVVPSEQLVIVRFGGRLGRDNWNGDFWDALDERLLMPVVMSGLISNHKP